MQSTKRLLNVLNLYAFMKLFHIFENAMCSREFRDMRLKKIVGTRFSSAAVSADGRLYILLAQND